MDHPAGTISYWILLVGLAVIALAPVGVQLTRGWTDRRRAAREAAERDFDQHWNSVVRDAK